MIEINIFVELMNISNVTFGKFTAKTFLFYSANLTFNIATRNRYSK